MKEITCVIPTLSYHKEMLERAVDGRAAINYIDSKIIELRDIKNSEIMLGNIPLNVVNSCTSLKWLQLSTAGSDTYAAPGILPKGCTLTNASGAFGLAIAEHMIGTLLEIYKKLHYYRDNQNNSLWQDEGSVETIEGKTVLVVGLGDIGSTFARKMKALGAHIIGIRRTAQKCPEYVDELYMPEMLDKLLPQADIVALSIPQTPQTDKLFSRERIALMKERSVLINVGRGSAVDTEALCDALESGKLLGASLDVTDPEPLPAEHRIWKIRNAVVTPHISGFFHLRETHDRIISIAAQNITRYFEGKPLINTVDMNTGYRRSDGN
ncbi:MAG: D-2-hydroxyacid dehydrogenase [Ruminococcaceae bacterium]|nr:D-2-hydroxyacid dehydrogenase [Oscillospiraceae bacterium]